MDVKDEWAAVYTPPNQFGWRSLRNRVDIDSLPPTDESVGMPGSDDSCECNDCGFIGSGRIGYLFHLTGDGEVTCDVCESYDVTGHGVASLKGVREP